MRVAGPSLALAALLIAAPAFAQAGGYDDSGSPYGRQQMNQYRYDNSPPQQDQSWQGPTQQGPMPYRQAQRQNREQSDRQEQSQSGPMQQGMQNGYPLHQMGMGQMGMGQMRQSPPGQVSFATQGQIKRSLEASGFKNITVLPQSYLIRATAPDGSRIMMQVSSEGVAGVVVNPSDEAASGGTGGVASSGTGSGTTNTTGADRTTNSAAGGVDTGTAGTGGAASGTTTGPDSMTGGATGSAGAANRGMEGTTTSR